MGPRKLRSAIRLFTAVWVTSTAALASATAQQTGTVTGLVTSASDARPLAGTQVRIPALDVGVLTNAQGRFFLPGVLAGRHEILAQRIGYRPMTQPVAVTAGQADTVNFALEERAISMEELVVTGVAAETPQNQVAFTIAKIDVAAVSKAPVISVGGLVAAKVPGVKVVQGSGQPGSEPSFQFRGPKSISGSQAPLVVIDGVVTSGGISDIDPADVASIEIVKGAAGAALYGSRAQAGVIQITTRTGRHLSPGQTQFTVRTTYEDNSIERYYGVPMHHQWMMNAGKTAILDLNGQPITYPRNGAPALNDGGNGRNAFTTFMNNPYPPELLPLRDPIRQFFNPGGRITNYVALAGNEGSTDYRISFDRMQEDGAITLIKGMTQYNTRINVGQAFGKFQVRTQAYFAKRTRSLLDEGGGGIIRTLTFTTAAADLLKTDSTGQIDPIGEPINQGNVGRNPVYTLLNTSAEEGRQRGMGSIDASWNPLRWLSLQGNGSFDRIETNTHRYERPGLIQPFTVPGTGFIEDRQDRRLEMNGSLTAALTFQPINDLTVRGRLRYLVESLDENGFSVQGQNLPVQGVERINLIGGTPTLNSYQRAVRSEGFFAVVALTYKERYILDLLGRRDGSSLFGVDQRWQNYHRASAAWRMSQEPWFPIGWLTEFKPRFSIGTSGGRPSFDAQYQTYQVSAGSIVPVTLGNQDLKPERATEKEFGIDAVIAERFQVQANYVKTKVEDQLLLVPLPSIAGFTSQWQNAATVEATTGEIALQASIIERENLLWTARLNLDRTKNRITHLGVAPYRISDYRAGLYIREGETLGSFYGWHYPTSCAELPQGTDCSQFQVNDEGYFVWVGAGNSWAEGKTKSLWGTSGTVNGVSYSWGLPISALNSTLTLPDTKLGDSEPSLNASFQQNFEWKGFGLTLLFDAERGAQVYNQTMQWRCRDGHCPLMDQAGKPDSLQKPITYYNAGGIYQNNKNNSAFTEDADYLKLRELSVRYTLERGSMPGFLRTIGISQATINLTGRNLKTWTSYSGFDPEVGKDTFGGSAAVGRIDEYFYPNFRSLGFDIELIF